MEQNPKSLFETLLCASVVPSSGAIGTAPNWAKVFKAASKVVSPATLIINCALQNPDPAVSYNWQTALRVRWGDTRGGGEAILDAANSVIATVGGSWLEVECDHKCMPVGILPGVGPSMIVTVSCFHGTVPHPMPIRSERVTVGAGVTSALLAVPAYAKQTHIECTPEVSGGLLLRGYQDIVPGAVPILEVSGRNILPIVGGLTGIAIVNTTAVARDVIAIHELSL